jgi:hypothetical protein
MTAMFDKAVRAGCNAQYVGEECLFPACETTTREDSACPHTKRAVLATIASLAEPDDATVEAMAQAMFEGTHNVMYTDSSGTRRWTWDTVGDENRRYWVGNARAAWAAGMAAIHKSN